MSAQLTIDILWLLVCSGLVFLMQPGFMCLESGFTRSKNSINVAIKNFVDFGIAAGLFWAFGYAIAFGKSCQGLFGTSGFLTTLDTDPKSIALFLFEMMFCGTATTIVSGAVAERMKFKAYLLVSALVSGFIYPLFAHWAWNGSFDGDRIGWLAKLGFTDFAGSTAVHSIGGWVALALLVAIGPRQGRFDRNGQSQRIHGSDLPLSVMGAMLLWFGWLGFNGGSAFGLSDRVGPIMTHTLLSGVAGMMAGLLWQTLRQQTPAVETLVNSSLAGMVSITASCNAATTPEVIAIGSIGGLVMLGVSHLLQRLRVDDAVDAVSVHLGGGIWGTLAAAFVSRHASVGSSWLPRLEVQLLGIAVAAVWAFGATLLVVFLASKFFALRVAPHDERLGLNFCEHHAVEDSFDWEKAIAAPKCALPAPAESLAAYRSSLTPASETSDLAASSRAIALSSSSSNSRQLQGTRIE